MRSLKQRMDEAFNKKAKNEACEEGKKYTYKDGSVKVISIDGDTATVTDGDEEFDVKCDALGDEVDEGCSKRKPKNESRKRYSARVGDVHEQGKLKATVTEVKANGQVVFECKGQVKEAHIDEAGISWKSLKKRIYEAEEGDKVTVDGKKVEITNIDGEKVEGEDKDGETVKFKMDDIKEELEVEVGDKCYDGEDKVEVVELGDKKVTVKGEDDEEYDIAPSKLSDEADEEFKKGNKFGKNSKK